MKYLQRMIAGTVAHTFRARDGAPADTKALIRAEEQGGADCATSTSASAASASSNSPYDGEDYVIQYMPVGMQEMDAPPELMLAQMMYAGVDHCVLQAGGAYGAMTEMNAFAQRQYPRTHDRADACRRGDGGHAGALAKVDHAFDALRLRASTSMSMFRRHGFPWPLDAREMAPFWDKLAGAASCSASS